MYKLTCMIIHQHQHLFYKYAFLGLLKLLGSLRETFNIPNGKEWKKESMVGLLGSSFEDGLYIQAVIEAIRKSSKENRWVKVNIITEEPDPNPVLTAAVRTSAISM